MNTLNALREDLNILILKSNIKTQEDLKKVDRVFQQLNCIKRWTVDLEDWEHVLKVESLVLSCENIAVILERSGIECSEMDH